MRTLFRILGLAVAGLALLQLTACGRSEQSTTASSSPTNGASQPRPNGNSFPVYGYDVVHVWPHDRGAFTQGLVFLDGVLLESTGLYGQSSLRRVDLETGNVLKRIEVPSQFFAEGLAALNCKLYQLTWKNQKCFVYDLETFRQEREFSYQGEGWGLTTDGHSLIMSDGTAQIRFLDPATFSETRRITVLANGHAVTNLNELEYVKGEIFANIWMTPAVARIDPASGKVVGAIDFRGLLTREDWHSDTDVLNGIAYDAARDRLFVTGKRWPKLFEVRLKVK